MKLVWLILTLLLPLTALARPADAFPIRNGWLQTDLDAGGKNLTNVAGILDTNGNPFATGGGGGSATVWIPTNQPTGFILTNGATVFYGTNRAVTLADLPATVVTNALTWIPTNQPTGFILTNGATVFYGTNRAVTLAEIPTAVVTNRTRGEQGVLQTLVGATNVLRVDTNVVATFTIFSDTNTIVMSGGPGGLFEGMVLRWNNPEHPGAFYSDNGDNYRIQGDPMEWVIFDVNMSDSLYSTTGEPTNAWNVLSGGTPAPTSRYASLTNFDGVRIAGGTINSNALDAATWAAATNQAQAGELTGTLLPATIASTNAVTGTSPRWLTLEPGGVPYWTNFLFAAGITNNGNFNNSGTLTNFGAVNLRSTLDVVGSITGGGAITINSSGISTRAGSLGYFGVNDMQLNSATTLRWGSDEASFSRPAVGAILAKTNLIVQGTVTATNGFSQYNTASALQFDVSSTGEVLIAPSNTTASSAIRFGRISSGTGTGSVGLGSGMAGSSGWRIYGSTADSILRISRPDGAFMSTLDLSGAGTPWMIQQEVNSATGLKTVGPITSMGAQPSTNSVTGTGGSFGSNGTNWWFIARNAAGVPWTNIMRASPSVFNIVDFGASPAFDSQVDNLPIQAAIDAAQVYARTNASGATVYCPPGHYWFSTNNPYTTMVEGHYNGIYFSNAINVRLVGAGREQTIWECVTNTSAIRDRGGQAPVFGWNWVGTTNTVNLYIGGITFNAQGWTNPGVEIIHAYNTTNMVIEDCTFENSSFDCIDIHLDNSVGAVVERNLNTARFNTFRNWGVNSTSWPGFYPGGNAIGVVSPMDIYGNVFEMPYTNGLVSYAIKNTFGGTTKIHDNTFLTQQVLESEGSADFFYDNDVYVRTNQSAPAIWLRSLAGGGNFEGNRFSCNYSTGDGYWFKVAYTNLTGGNGTYRIAYNDFGGHGVLWNCVGGEKLTIENNRFTPFGSSYPALRLTGTNTQGVIVANNEVTGGGTTSFYLGNSTTADAFHNAQFVNNRGFNSNLRVGHKGTNCLVANNTATGEASSGHAFVIGMGTGTNWTVRDNIAFKAMLFGAVDSLYVGNQAPTVDVSTYNSTRSRLRDNKWDSFLISSASAVGTVLHDNKGPTTNIVHNIFNAPNVTTNGLQVWYGSTNVVPTWNMHLRILATDTNAPAAFFVLTNDGGANTGWFAK